MRIARILRGGRAELALVEACGTRLRPTGVAESVVTLLEEDRMASLEAAALAPEPLDPRALLPPLEPRVIVGVGLNYRAHAAEQGRALPDAPALFLKNPRSIAAPVSRLVLEDGAPALDHEAELGVVLGPGGTVAGFLVVQDLTRRALARPETLTIAKGGPGMAPIGPWLTTPASMGGRDPGDLAIRSWVNGEPMQDSRTSDMHHGIGELVAHAVRWLALGAGDLLLTGSPGGTGVSRDPPRWLADGDVLETEIEGLGRLHQTVVRQSSRRPSRCRRGHGSREIRLRARGRSLP